MEIEDYNYEKNSNTISKEERDAFIDRFKRACRAKGMTVQQLQNIRDALRQTVAKDSTREQPTTNYIIRGKTFLGFLCIRIGYSERCYITCSRTPC